MSFLLLSFMFFCYKIREQEGGTGYAQERGEQGGGQRWQEKGRRVNKVQITYTRVLI
jgi:hypothetical protein